MTENIEHSCPHCGHKLPFSLILDVDGSDDVSGYQKCCKICSYEWTSYIERPKRCPRCGSYRWNSDIKAVECKRCGSSWIPRGDGAPVRCPNCKSDKWDTPADDSADPFSYGRTDDNLYNEIIRRYDMGDGCLNIARSDNIALSTVIKTLHLNYGKDEMLRM